MGTNLDIALKIKSILKQNKAKLQDENDISLNEFKQKEYYRNTIEPIFFLSTGRTGTKWFTELLSHSDKCQVHHNPIPLLMPQNRIVYEKYASHDYDFSQNIYNDLINQIFLAGRESHLLECYKEKKYYIETNDKITFFAPALAQLFPKAKFVHLYRHPGEFVRSGIRRGWYQGHPFDIGRIRPLQNNIHNEAWDNFDSIQKNSWLWNETNSFIDLFMDSIDSKRATSFNFNNLNFENVNTLFNFLNIHIEESEIKMMLDQKINAQKKGDFPDYKDWNAEDKNKLISICGDRAQSSGYIL